MLRFLNKQSVAAPACRERFGLQPCGNSTIVWESPVPAAPGIFSVDSSLHRQDQHHGGIYLQPCTDFMVVSRNAWDVKVNFSPGLVRMAPQIGNPKWESLDVSLCAKTLGEILKVKQAPCSLNFCIAPWLYLWAPTDPKNFPWDAGIPSPVWCWRKKRHKERKAQAKVREQPRNRHPNTFLHPLNVLLLMAAPLLVAGLWNSSRNPSLASMCSEAHLNSKPGYKSLEWELDLDMEQC